MADILGLGIDLPTFNLTGFFSSSWIYVFIICTVGFILIAVVAILIFLSTFNKKIVLFENIAGQGYQPIQKLRARLIKLGVGGEELMKTMMGGKFFTAYGRKMGKNTYWFARGQDGYYYNILLGDLDAKRAMLDIEPIDRDVRMFHVALDRLAHQTYGKQGWLEKYGIHMMLFVFLIIFILGMWFIVGKIGDATQPYYANQDKALKLTEKQIELSGKLDSIARSLGRIPEEIEVNINSSGLVPAT